MSEILVGLDGSSSADDALSLAERVARAAGASLRLVSAYPYDDLHARASNEAFRDDLRQDAEAILASAAATLKGVDAVTEAVADVSAPHALHDLAERSDAALVVVGSTHRGPVGRVLPGSTGERLLHNSPCPVAVAPRGYAQGARPIATVGVGYDNSKESVTALAAACQLARRLGAELRVIDVFDATRVGTPALMTGPAWMTMRDEHEAVRRDELERAVAELPPDVDAKAVFLVGRPAEQLASQSKALDMMVVGSRGHWPFAAVLLGGVSHGLLRDAACPVVVLPRGAYRGMDALLSSVVDALRAE